MTRADYLRLLTTYAHSQHISLPDGRTIPWIDEDLDPDMGAWIARDILMAQHALPKNRGRYYNHSGFADLVITGLIGLRPQAGNEVEVHPLLPANTWSYFALDDLPYHGHLLTIFYDRTGTRYHRGAGNDNTRQNHQVKWKAITRRAGWRLTVKTFRTRRDSGDWARGINVLAALAKELTRS